MIDYYNLNYKLQRVKVLKYKKTLQMIKILYYQNKKGPIGP